MTSAREDVTGASARLRAAEYKILEMELDITQLAQRANASDIEVAKVKQENEKLKEKNGRQSNILHELTRLLGTAGINSLPEAVERLHKKIEKLSQKPQNLPFSELVGKFNELKKELQELQDYRQFETDTKLSEIRKVLGARNTNNHNSMASPHETALQAAKRVMGELKGRQDDLSELVALRKVADLARDVAGLVPGSSNGALIGHLKTLKTRQAFSSRQFGARTYNPPYGHMVIRTEDFTQLFKDSEDLKVIKEKLGLT